MSDYTENDRSSRPEPDGLETIGVTGRRFGGIVGIGGGIAGLSTIPPILLRSNDLASYLISAPIALLFGFGVWSGVRVFEGRAGATESLLAFLWLQVPIVQTGVVSYFFAALAS